MTTTKIETLTRLAAVVGKDESILRRLRRNGTWPAGVPDRGPWTAAHVAAVRTWLADRARRRRRDPDLERERKALMRSKIARLKLETAIAQGRMLRRDDVERRALRAAAKCRTALLSLPRHAAAELVNRHDAEAVETILMRRLEAIAGQYQADLRDDGGAVESPLVDDD